jgi:hypothetical protein
MVAIDSTGTNFVFKAGDQAGHTGFSAPFDIQPLTGVAVVASPADGGTVSGGGSYVAGSQQTIAAAPASGWQFTAWQDSATANPRVITVPSSAVTFTALFAPLPPASPDFQVSTLNWQNGIFTAALDGISGSNYTVLVSTDLKTWTPLTNLQFNGASIHFNDTNALAPWQFYQLQSAPR